MKKQITKISIHQTSKVIAVTFIWLGAVYAVIMFLALLVGGGAAGWALIMGILCLILFPILGYLSPALFTYFYNKAAGRVGGIEFVLEEFEEE